MIRSIAWGIAAACAAQGAEIAFTYQGEALEKRVRPLAESVGSSLVLPCDVGSEESIDSAFAAVEQAWGKIDFLVHAIGWADKAYLRGRYVDTPRAAFLQALDISCYSFVAVAQRAERMMNDGGSMLTLTYLGAERVMPHYNVMGCGQGRAGGLSTLPSGRPRRAEHPRQRHQRRPDQDAGGQRHRRLPLHSQVE